MATRSLGRETKFQRVSAEVESLANRLGPEEKLPSIRELALTVGASIDTLSGVLQELETRNIVYRRHGVGIFVSPKRVTSLWVLCDSQFFSQGHSPFWDILVEHTRSRAAQFNEQLSLHFTLPQGQPDSTLHHTLVEEIRSGRVHGIIGIGLARSTARWILEQGVPYTAFAAWAPYVVVINGASMARMGVEQLVAQGCRRIGLWKPTLPQNPNRDSENASCEITEAFAEALARHNVPLVPELIKDNRHLWLQEASEPFPQQGYRTAREAFEGLDSPPDGVIITDDTMAQGALLAMARMGVRPGQDLKIASHANKGTSVLLDSEDEIIRLEFDPAEVVRRLFSLLETLMAGKTPEDSVPYFADAQALSVEPRVVVPSHAMEA